MKIQKGRTKEDREDTKQKSDDGTICIPPLHWCFETDN
jgi:hypothetical protein